MHESGTIPNRYSAIADLYAIDRLPELGPGTPNRALEARLRALTPASVVAPHPVHDVAMAQACIAGLWLLHDFLEESHAISQENPTSTGSFWHAIMHRREPDAWNSKYWWRKVGAHPVLTQLAEQAARRGLPFTHAFDFVDFCERVRGRSTPEELLARQVQRLEWDLLFAWCYDHAIAPKSP